MLLPYSLLSRVASPSPITRLLTRAQRAPQVYCIILTRHKVLPKGAVNEKYDAAVTKHKRPTLVGMVSENRRYVAPICHVCKDSILWMCNLVGTTCPIALSRVDIVGTTCPIALSHGDTMANRSGTISAIGLEEDPDPYPQNQHSPKSQVTTTVRNNFRDRAWSGTISAESSLVNGQGGGATVRNNFRDWAWSGTISAESARSPTSLLTQY